VYRNPEKEGKGETNMPRSSQTTSLKKSSRLVKKTCTAGKREGEESAEGEGGGDRFTPEDQRPNIRKDLKL